MIKQAHHGGREPVTAVLLVCASGVLLVTLLGRVLLDSLLLGPMTNSNALWTAWVLLLLSLAGSGLYHLHTIRER